MSVVEIENIGPVSHLSIPIPPAGGVVVLKARNGKGKSRVIQAVDAVVTGRGKLDVKDGRKSGSVSGFGVVLKVGRSTRRSGELEVESLEGKLSVADLVDPGIKSPEAADAKRIKALTQLSGAECSLEQFHPLLGGKAIFEKIVHRSSMETDDLVELAAKIKRDIESQARTVEAKAEQVKGRGDGLLAAAGDVEWDATLPETIDPLQAEADAAYEALQALNVREEILDKMTKERESDEGLLSRIRDGWKGGTVQDCQVAASTARKTFDRASEIVHDLQRQLEQAELEFQRASELEIKTREALERAEEHAKVVAELEEAINKPLQAVKPTEAEFEAAKTRLQQARASVAGYEVKRKAKQDRDAAQKCKLEYVELLRQVKQLREAAKGTDDVLTDVVGKTGCALRVEAGRLVCETVRGSTYYSELSAGERWTIAIDIAVSAVGNRGVLTIPQEAWEGLDSINRQTIAEHAVKRGVVILTAECSTAEEVTPEFYGLGA